MMPGMDGFDVLQALRNDDRTKDVAVIIVTGLEDDESKEKAFSLGVAGYLLKPINIRSLIETVRTAISDRAQATKNDQTAESDTQ